MRNIRLQVLIEVAIFAALAMVLDFLPSIRFGPSISISFAMVPVFIIAFRWGFSPAVLSGFLWGILQIALGDAWILTPVQAFIEYFIAFACVGFAGLFAGRVKENMSKKRKGRAMAWAVVAVFSGGFARYFWHFIAGVIFFRKYAFEAGKSPITFSFTMNGITYLATSILCAVIIILIFSRAGNVIITANRTGSGQKVG